MVKLEQLHFSSAWNNKLLCHYFTTIRLTDKYKVGEEIEIFLNNHHIHNARILDKKHIKLDSITDWTGYIDTGYNAEKTKNILRKMYSKYDIDWSVKPLTIYLIDGNIERK